MTVRRAIAAIATALAAQWVFAAEPAEWPPPPAVQERMKELQKTIANPAASKEDREAARRELTRLLKSRAARDTVEKDDAAKRPPRAAIEPIPPIVKQTDGSAGHPGAGRGPIASPPVAHIDVTSPPKPVVIPKSGSLAVPSTGVAIDPRTGAVLQEVPNGYVDPRTGQFVPRH